MLDIELEADKERGTIWFSIPLIGGAHIGTVCCRCQQCKWFGLAWLTYSVGKGASFLTHGDHYLSPRLLEEGETAVFIYSIVWTTT
jgi:hypothetical protein